MVDVVVKGILNLSIILNTTAGDSTVASLVPDFRFIRSLNLHAGAFLESLVTFVCAGVGLSHVTITHTFMSVN